MVLKGIECYPLIETRYLNAPQRIAQSVAEGWLIKNTWVGEQHQACLRLVILLASNAFVGGLFIDSQITGFRDQSRLLFRTSPIWVVRSRVANGSLGEAGGLPEN